MNIDNQQETEGATVDVFTSGEFVVLKFRSPVMVVGMKAPEMMAFVKMLTEAANYVALMGETDGKVH